MEVQKQPTCLKTLSLLKYHRLYLACQTAGAMLTGGLAKVQPNDKQPARQAGRRAGRQPGSKWHVLANNKDSQGSALTAFRSNTPSFASCSKVTNLVVSSPRLFSCLLGVCGCNESPTAPSSPLMLADSSSIIARDQRRTSPCLPRPNPASERKEKEPPRRQPKNWGGRVRDLQGAGGQRDVPTWFAPRYFLPKTR